MKNGLGLRTPMWKILFNFVHHTGVCLMWLVDCLEVALGITFYSEQRTLARQSRRHKNHCQFLCVLVTKQVCREKVASYIAANVILKIYGVCMCCDVRCSFVVSLPKMRWCVIYNIFGQCISLLLSRIVHIFTAVFSYSHAMEYQTILHRCGYYCMGAGVTW